MCAPCRCRVHVCLLVCVEGVVHWHSSNCHAHKETGVKSMSKKTCGGARGSQGHGSGSGSGIRMHHTLRQKFTMF